MAVYDREEDAPQVNLYGRKMKLLEVMRILERETDAEHALTANRIAARLEEKGFPHADRKGIYDDINVLNCFLKPGGGGGCKRPRIEKDEITFGYYLDNRPFSVADLKLIIDALLSSRFLSGTGRRAGIALFRASGQRAETADHRCQPREKHERQCAQQCRPHPCRD